jgi:hypothetical protein
VQGLTCDHHETQGLITADGRPAQFDVAAYGKRGRDDDAVLVRVFRHLPVPGGAQKSMRAGVNTIQGRDATEDVGCVLWFRFGGCRIGGRSRARRATAWRRGQGDVGALTTLSMMSSSFSDKGL